MIFMGKSEKFRSNEKEIGKISFSGQIKNLQLNPILSKILCLPSAGDFVYKKTNSFYEF